MARDEEFRKVAEDLRALGRSLARDFWQATDGARRSGRQPGDAIRHGMRQVVGEARRQIRGADHWKGWYGYQRWGPPRPHRYNGGPPHRHGWGPPAPPAPRRPRRPAPPPVRRRWDATTVAGTLVVLFGAAWLLGALQVLRVPVEAVVAVGLMLLGAAVIVTARTDWSLSRHSWPVWVGAGLVVVLIAASSTLGIAGTLDHVSFGTMQRTAVPGQTVYGGFGTLTVDAAALAPGSTLRIQSAAGETFVNTPPGVPLDVHARVLAGRVCLEGVPRAQGLEADVNGLFGSSTSAVAPLRLDVHQLAGVVIIDGASCNRP